MEQPQHDAELAPIRAKLREMDAGLRVEWNPVARVTRPGSFDAYGQTYAPTSEGRWEVKKRGNDGRDVVLYQVCFDGDRQQAYRPVGWWLVEHLQRWDMAQRHAVDAWAKAWAEDEQAKANTLTIQHEADAEQLLERIANELSGDTAVSVGADFTP